MLEKKARGRGFSLTRPWTVRTFKLTKQSLEYYDGDRLKGTVEICGASTTVIPSEEADHKLFPFQVDNGKEKLILNASCEEIRQRCLEIFKQAASNPNWTLVPAVDPNPALIAALSLMQPDEREKLEAEQKRLEEERLKAVADATARQMEEQLANKRLQQARVAEKEQQEAQVCFFFFFRLLLRIEISLIALLLFILARRSYEFVKRFRRQGSFQDCFTT